MAKFRSPAAYSDTVPVVDPTGEPGVVIGTGKYTMSKAPVVVPKLNVIFHIRIDGGTLQLPQEGTGDMLDEILRRYNTEGLTIHNQDGFEWYPPHAIKQVKVVPDKGPDPGR